MLFGIISISIGLLIIVCTSCSHFRQQRAAESEQAAREQSAREKARQHEHKRQEEARQAAQAQAARKAAAAQKKQDAERRRQEREAKQDAAHAVKAARAAELAELAERRLQAEKELVNLRQHAEEQPAQRRETISDGSAQDAAEQPALTLDQFAASIAPQPFPVACMLAKKYAENAPAIAGKSFTITEKLDGVRCIARVDHTRVELYARSGARLDGLTDIENALAALNISAVLDGELLINGRGALPSKEEYKQTCSIIRSSGRKTGIVYHVFDMLPLDVYAARSVSAPYSARRTALDRLKTISPVEIVPVLYAGTDQAMIETCLQAQRAARHEGIMLNLNDAPYAFSRSSALLKYKVMNDCDLQIIAVNPGAGRFAGTLGSLSVAYKGGIVRVGAGIPDALRAAIWQNPAAYIGRVVTVQYFEETQDRTGKKSLRFPAFKELRELGKTFSYA